MKDDAPTPAEVPTKRRHIRAALDRWIAEWLARDDLTPRERKRVEAERQRRRTEPEDVTVGVLVGPEGMTPPQRETVTAWVAFAMPTVVCHVNAAGFVRRFYGAAIVEAPDHRAVVRASDVVIAAPRAVSAVETPVVDAIRYAKHRHVPVHIVLPNGEDAA